MPGKVSIDLAPLWHRELSVVGALRLRFRIHPARRRAPTQFRVGHRPGSGGRIGIAVSAAYPLERYEEAIGHAGAAGRRGATKVVFDLRTSKGTTR